VRGVCLCRVISSWVMIMISRLVFSMCSIIVIMGSLVRYCM